MHFSLQLLEGTLISILLLVSGILVLVSAFQKKEKIMQDERVRWQVEKLGLAGMRCLRVIVGIALLCAAGWLIHGILFVPQP